MHLMLPALSHCLPPAPSSQDIQTMLQSISSTHGTAMREKAGVDAELLRLQRLVRAFQERIAQVR